MSGGTTLKLRSEVGDVEECRVAFQQIDRSFKTNPYVSAKLFDAHTMLYAVADNTPLALTIAEQTIVGRVTAGNIDALTDAEVHSIIFGTSNPVDQDILLGAGKKLLANDAAVEIGTTGQPISSIFANTVTIRGGNELRFSDVGDSHYVGFTAPALTATQIWTLPSVDGSATEPIVTDGSAVLSFANHTAIYGGLLEAFNGGFLEPFDATVSSDGATITLSLEKTGTGDLTMVFSDGFSILDCTSPLQTIVLTAGSDAAPQENFVYVLKSTKALTVSTSDWPSTEHNKVAFLLVQSAGTVATKDPLINQNWNDFSAGGDGMGHILHMADRERHDDAQYHSGIAATITITTNGGSEDNVDLATTAGTVFQMHRHTFLATDTGAGDDLHVVNHNAAAYTVITDINQIDADATGSSITNKYFNVVVWGVANKTGEISHVMLNLPTKSYNNSKDAINDVDNGDVFTIPDSYKLESSTGFYIARYTFRYQAAASGTWTLINTDDLRGQTPSTVSGGAGGLNIVEFSDSHFRIFDDLDDTKIVAFQVSGLTTATTRTFTFPDADGTIELTSHLHDGDTLQLDAINSDGGAFSFTTSGAVTFSQAINAATGSTIGTLTLADGSITDSSGAITFDNENLVTTGTLGTGTHTITTGDLIINRIAAANDRLVFNKAGVTSGAISGNYQRSMLHFGVFGTPGNVRLGNQFVFGSYPHSGLFHDHGVPSNPTVFVHSATSPDVSNNEWGSFVHDQTGFVITTGVNTGAGTSPATIDNYIMFSPRGTECFRCEGSGHALVASTNRWQFRDSALYISSEDDGHLDLTADTSIDLNAAVVMSGGSLTDTTGAIDFGDETLTTSGLISANGGVTLAAGKDLLGTTTSDIGAVTAPFNEIFSVTMTTHKDAGNAAWNLFTHSDTPTHWPYFQLQRSRGTFASQTAISSADRIGGMLIRGHDGTTYRDAVYLITQAAENFTGASNHGAHLDVYTTPIGAASPVNCVRFHASGVLFSYFGLNIADGKNVVVATTTGTKWATAANQKQAWWNATPVVQPVHIADADGTLGDITTKFNTLLAQMAATGMQAAA